MTRLIPYKVKCDFCGYKSEEIYEDSELTSLWQHQEEQTYFPNSLQYSYLEKKDFCSRICLERYNENNNCRQ